MSNQRSSQDPSQRSGKEAEAGVSRTRMSSGGSPSRQSGTTSTITSQVQGALDQQVVRGAKVMTNVAQSARRAADELESDAPQIAGLVRGVADRVEQYSRSLENQSVTDIYQTASDFTRRQPAVEQRGRQGGDSRRTPAAAGGGRACACCWLTITASSGVDYAVCSKRKGCRSWERRPTDSKPFVSRRSSGRI